VVGAVIVRDGRVVGEGFHPGPGLPHAERVALRQAGSAARGATLYCTLEPCCHHGRTPPCTDGILEAGVAAVYFSVGDPDPQVSGGGAAILRQAGVPVVEGVLRQAVEDQLRSYLHHRRTGRPWVLAKWAMTLDGKLATASGDSRWISSPESRALVHLTRDRVDAILTGSGTVLADDPQLTCRLGDFGPVTRATRNPVRVVVDSHGRTPATAQVYTDGQAPTWLATADETVERPAAEILRLPGSDGRVNLAVLLDELGRRGVVELMVEAGGELLGELFGKGLVDEVMAFVAPKLAGGPHGIWPGEGVAAMADALQLTAVRTMPCGPDIVIRGRVERHG
jgi:diaminohydroxyphosphoribosylaminopyrimidine deaminase/5-amino-6-(5-phosphoribosylamino)uracil reductase